ncbi:MAG: hypothetical protein JWL73_2090 [Actinomycetia bacterium]|nr:hypothetical protein [Actinomycetes bacterium]
MADPAIVVTDLVKHFGDVPAVDGVSFDVESGTVLGLLGPNGAGKTTIVRVLTTIIRPDAGRATVLGIDVARDPQAVRTVIGLAGQYAAVDENLTGRENLKLIGRLTHLKNKLIDQRSDELLERFDLVHAQNRPVRTYSGGMRRRLDLAGSLVNHPPVLFLDEPTTGLDPRSRIELWNVIGELVNDGTTVLLTTQYLEEADRLADQIVVINGGKVVEEGTAAELKARLGQTIIEVDANDPALAERVQAALSPLGTATIHDNGERVALQVDNGPKAMIAVVRALDAGGIEPAGLEIREPTLDDVFLALTGQPATPEARESSGDDR